MIPFNIPPCGRNAIEYMRQAVENQKICGDGPFTKKCDEWIEQRFQCQKSLLTTSGTHALEMAARLCNFNPGDEVILPSFTFSSTASAFILSGATPVFIDIKPDTMNMNEELIEAAITDRTKAICVVHYAGVACEMDTIMKIAAQYQLKVIEDAAQAVMSAYRGIALGTIGDFGCFSFHETKNYSMGEGGALLIRDACYNEQAEILREKGTDRSKMLRGQTDKYSWLEAGSSYLPSDLNAAYLWAQLEQADEINHDRCNRWSDYYAALRPLEQAGKIELPVVPAHCIGNGHMFFLKVKDIEQRTALIQYLKDNGILSVFHYVPLHSAPAGLKYGRFVGEDRYTTNESNRLLRLPMYYCLRSEDQEYIIRTVKSFFAFSE